MKIAPILIELGKTQVIENKLAKPDMANHFFEVVDLLKKSDTIEKHSLLEHLARKITKMGAIIMFLGKEGMIKRGVFNQKEAEVFFSAAEIINENVKKYY